MSSYQGLVNQGTTCYLNSLLQTLFMTRQFRQNVYAYRHDPKKIDEKDSIPYQLQKLFVKLQIKDKAVYTKQLLRSFQWNDQESFQQHDVQEFCRILFQSIEKAHKNTIWIKDLFGGTMHSYVDCGQHRSIREEMFLDIALPIRNQYTLKTYQSIEESLRDYLRPEKLEDKFQCSGCGEKVFVEKGLKLGSVPPILTLQLNRFELNLETFMREKVNSFFYFPQILQLHRFMVPYAEMKLKGLPEGIQIKTVTVAKEKSMRSVNLHSLEADVPLTRKKSDDKIKKKEVVKYYDEENKDKRENQQKELSKEDQKARNLEILAQLKAEKGKLDEKLKEKKKDKEHTQTTAPASADLDDDPLFGMGGLGSVSSSGWAQVGSFDKNEVVGSSSKAPTFQKTQTKFQHEEQSFDPKKEYPDMTYALYAVLVHAGGSYGGHYFAYITDGNNWYKFDDANVTKVSKRQIRQYGVNSNSSFGSNAYLLFYRDVRTFQETKDIQIPQQLLEKIKIQEQKLEELKKKMKADLLSGVPVSSEKMKRLDQLRKSMIVKVWKQNSTDVFKYTVFDKAEETVNSLRKCIKEHFGIEEKEHNWRLRRYNKNFDSMYEAYEAADITLEQLQLGQQINLIVQFKKQEQTFQPYDPRKIIVKVSVWQQEMITLSQRKAKAIKIPVFQENTFSQLTELIKKATGISNPLVIKRNFSHSNPVEKMNWDKNTFDRIAGKKLIDLRFFNNITIYVEENTEEKVTKWEVEFQNQKHRCQFKFNNPRDEEKMEELCFDTRRTLGQLKEAISKVIGLDVDNFRIKKSKNALSEMTTYKKKLNDLRFINSQILYLEQGVSSKGSVIVHRGEVGLVNDKIEFNVFQELQYELAGDLTTIADLKRKISESTSIPCDNIRVRQYKNFQFKQIYTESTQIHRIREKSLIWQLVQGDLPKGLQIYYRIFDILTFQFGELKNLYADYSSSYQQLALLIEEETGIDSGKVLVWRPLSNCIEKEYMLDVEWVQIKYIQATIKEEPLLVRTDGDILIIKAADSAYQRPEVKKKEVLDKYPTKGKEAQLKITVIQENQNPDSQKIEAEGKKEQTAKVVEQPSKQE